MYRAVDAVKILDRYIIRETIPPFLLALGLFTFLLQVNPMLANAKNLLAKGVDLGSVAYMLATLLPQALGVTLPMALMAGLLMALGRLSGDRESVALLACGVSPLTILRPVLVLAVAVGALDLYVMTNLVPDWNQRFREESYRLLVQRGQDDIKPGIFYEGFPQKALLVKEVLPGGIWRGIVLADTSQPDRPAITIARRGFLDLEPARKQVSIVLQDHPVRYLPGQTEGIYDTATDEEVRIAIPADQIFGDGSTTVTRGGAEMRIADLQRVIDEKMEAGRTKGLDRAGMFKEGLSPHPEILRIHQMFSFPVACLVFAVIGVVLGLHTRREGKLGGFTLGIVVIGAYYGVMTIFENLTKGGHFPAEWTRWVPNIVFGALGAAALRAGNRALAPSGTIALPAWLARIPRAWPRRLAPRAKAVKAPPRPAVIIRVPVLDLPRPRLLDRYVMKRYLSIAGVSFFGLLMLYYIGTFIDRSERLFKGQASGALMAEYFAYATPQFVIYLVPLATLVAVLATIGGLTRSSELTVMRACGVSLYRASAPIFALALVWAGGLFLLDDRVLAHANLRAERLENQLRGQPPPAADLISTSSWLVDPGGRILYYRAYESSRRVLHHVSIFEQTPDGARLASHTMIPVATHVRDAAWRVDSGWRQRFTGRDRAVREMVLPGQVALLQPDRFGSGRQAAELMTYSDLRRYIADLGESGVSLKEQETRLQARVAFPMVAIVMTLLGIPFGVTTGRRGALYGIGLAVILGTAYFLVNTFFLAAGSAGVLPPLLAAWAANLLFLAGALYAVLTVRT